jgi:hypothetical protein
MAKCNYCGREMLTANGCSYKRVVIKGEHKGEHYVEALYEQDFGSFPLAMGANHFSIKNGLEFMAFIVDRKETYCKSAAFALLFDDYRKADSNWVTAEMREKFLAYIEKTYTPSAEVMKDKNGLRLSCTMIPAGELPSLNPAMDLPAAGN